MVEVRARDEFRKSLSDILTAEQIHRFEADFVRMSDPPRLRVGHGRLNHLGSDFLGFEFTNPQTLPPLCCCC